MCEIYSGAKLADTPLTFEKTYASAKLADNLDSDTNNIQMKHCNTKMEIYNQKQKKGVKIEHLNIRSLLKKIDENKILIHQNSFDILAISETWLLDKIPNELVNIPCFNVYRKDRLSHGGGVLIYIYKGDFTSYILSRSHQF